MEKEYLFECSINLYSSKYTDTITAKTHSKARYQFYLNMDFEEPYSEYFRFIHVRKIGDCPEDYISEKELQRQQEFKKVIEYRNIPFAEIGMKINVNGKEGKIVGANDSANLDVDFGNGRKSNCHPTWKTSYYDQSNNLIKSFN